MVIIAAAGLIGSARAQLVPPSYGFDFVTIGGLGNPGNPGGPNGELVGRGGVDYAFRISKLEITSSQWLEFLNTYSGALHDPYNFMFVQGGFEPDPNYTGPGLRWRLLSPQSGDWPVFGLSWRNAARYCNWLHNQKVPTLAALDSGAYDTSTWGSGPGGTFLDQHEHLPGAKYWIPTLDEWIKAAYWDPNRYGAGQGGYWLYPNSSDQPLSTGAPGQGQTSAGLLGPVPDPGHVPLGAYPTEVSPWGLLDLSGGGGEWTEGVFENATGSYSRVLKGRPAGPEGVVQFGFDVDLLWTPGAERPTSGGPFSIRVASFGTIA
jgi:formylglycine-generating enzyme required for sulfatase activity